MNIKLIDQHNLSSLGQMTSWGHSWEPRTKIMVAILLIIGIVYLKTLWLISLTLGVIFVVALSMKLPLFYLLPRLLLFLPFFIFMGIPILFGKGYPPSPEAIEFLLIIICKGVSSLLIMIIVVSTQSPQVLFNGLAHMKLPPVIITIFFLTYRYIFLFLSDLVSIRRALISRSYLSDFSIRSIKLYGQLAGGFLIKSIDGSDAVYKAMASRGFDGTIPTSIPNRITRLDGIKVILVLGYILIIIVIEGSFFQ